MRYDYRIRNAKVDSGYTLIELLAVLCVVAVLAGLLFPVFASARESGRRATCLANERQVGIAMSQYVTDADEAFPGGLVWAGDKWVSKTHPYTRNTALLRCPDAAPPSLPREATDIGPGFPVSYGLNANLGHKQDDHHPLPAEGLSLADVTAPAKSVLFFEAGGWSNFDPNSNDLDGSVVGNGGDTGGAAINGEGSPLTDPTYPTMGSSGFGPAPYATGNIGGRLLNGATKNGQVLNRSGSTPRHAGGANYVACDGHAVWLRPEVVSGGENAAAADCLQGTDHGQPSGCVGQTEHQAAGTGSGRYTLTFSIR